jgi:HlyD family secretion protein
LRNEPKEDQNVVSYEAVLSVDNSELLLRPGMTATAAIVAEFEMKAARPEAEPPGPAHGEQSRKAPLRSAIPVMSMHSSSP